MSSDEPDGAVKEAEQASHSPSRVGGLSLVVAVAVAVVTPALVWTAMDWPTTIGDQILLIAVGFFVMLVTTGLPRGLGLVVIGWWVLSVALFGPTIASAHAADWPLVGPYLDAWDVPPDGVVRAAWVLSSLAWWWLAFGREAVAWWSSFNETGDAAAEDAPPVEPDPGEETRPRRSPYKFGPAEVGFEDVPPRGAGPVVERVETPPPGGYVDRYRDVVIGDPDRDSEPLLDRIVGVFPAERRRPGRAVALQDIATELGVTRGEVEDALDAAGVPYGSPERAQRPLHGGAGTRASAVEWGVLQAVVEG